MANLPGATIPPVLARLLQKYRQVAVAFSGGADSSLLLAAACITLGPDRVLALHAASELVPQEESRFAADCAHRLGCAFLKVAVSPLLWPEFVTNPPDRCYHCKKNIYRLFLDQCRHKGGLSLLDGTNADDLLEPRPGLKALAELCVDSPLALAGLSKTEVRQAGRSMGLSAWNRPSASCLATRIATGEAITQKKIDLVASAETILAEFGLSASRVRLASGEATIAVRDRDRKRLLSKRVFLNISKRFAEIGLDVISVDPHGRPDCP